jgi:hypothetical protein
LLLFFFLFLFVSFFSSSLSLGKTFAVREVFKGEQQHCAFVDCAAVIGNTESAKTLFTSILEQLSGHAVGSENNWKTRWNCVSRDQFALCLTELGEENGTSYIILDNAEALVEGVGSDVFSWLIELAFHTVYPVGVLFVSRRDWRRCARGFSAATVPMEVFFAAWTEEETKKLLLQKIVLDSKKQENRYALTNTKSGERWATRLWNSVNVYSGPLFGMGVLYVVGLDGYQKFERPVKQGKSLNQIEQLQSKAADSFLQQVNSQESSSFYQDGSLYVEPTPQSGMKKKKAGERKADEARTKRLRILEKSSSKSSSLPVHEAAIVIAGYLAMIVPKEKDQQLFSDVGVRKNQTKSSKTIGSRAEKKVHHFGMVRLLNIFRHVINDYQFQATPFWYSGVQSMVNAGYLERRKTKVDHLNVDPKVFKCTTTLATVYRLAEEIGYQGVSMALDAQI